MSEEGVSSVAVVEGETGALLSAVSVTDIGKAGARMDQENGTTDLRCVYLDCGSVTKQPNTLDTTKSVYFTNKGMKTLYTFSVQVLTNIDTGARWINRWRR